MKKIQVLMVGLVVGFAGVAGAQGESCPNLAGEWQGSCTYEGNSPEALNFGLKGLASEGERTIKIEQGVMDQLPCGYVKVDGQEYMIGGLKTLALNSPSDSMVSVSSSEGARWNGDKLEVLSTGIINFGEKFSAYKAQQTLGLEGEDRLVSSANVVSDDVNLQISCAYTRL